MAGNEIGDLIDLLSLPESDLYQKLGSDSVILGFRKLYSIFNYGAQSATDGKLGFQNWNPSQIQALVSVAQTLVSATKSLSVDQAEPIVVRTVLKVLEFSVLYLEKSEFIDDDLSIQNDVAHVLEIALIDGISKECDAMHPRSGNAIVDLMSVSDVDCGDIEFENNYKCISQGVSCAKVEKPINRLLMALETDSMQPDNQAPQFFISSSYQDLNKLISVSRHWAVVHMRCLHRFITLCKENIVCINFVDDKVAVIPFLKRLSFSLRVLKLLVNLAKVIPRVESETNLLQEIALFTDALPRLFRHGVEYVYSHTPAESSFESLGLSVMEEFLDLVRIIFFNSIVYQNVLACIVASMVDNLDCSIWRYNKSASNVKPPLSYFPRIVLYILKLLENIQILKYQAIDWKDIKSAVGVTVDFQSDSLSCHVNSERISLLKKYSIEELLQVIFPSSKNWVDNIMNLIFFLHSEGIKLKPKLDRSYSSCTKSTYISEMDNTVGHEDEALFGDLFSEGGRSMGSIEDQPAAAVISTSYYNLPNHVASDLLRFLKVSVFSPEWHHSVFDDGCKKLTRDHIDILLSILNCQECLSESDERTITSTLHEQSKMGHLHEVCFELLHNLITHHAMSDPIEEYLVEQILKAEKGIFVYNDQTLTLLAHIVICRSGPAGVQLRTQMYRGFVEFILEKAKALLLESSSISEVLRCLPSTFHIEILLTAFHLSSEKEKATLANFIFCSLGEINAPTAGFINSKQLACVALLLSRLILVLRHMIFHSSICPPSLLLDLRSRFKKVHVVGYNPSITTAYLASWASVATESVTGAWIIEDSDMRNLVSQLIDVAIFPASLCGDDFDIQCLNLSWDAIFASFSRIVGFWKGKKASSAEDLIVERYVFSLCWDIPLTGSEHLVPLWDKQNIDTSNMEYFFHFCHALLGNVAAIRKVNFPNVLNVFQQLHDFQSSLDIEEPGWDLLRCDMWLSLFLSLLDVGISRYNMKSSISEGSPIMTEKTSRNNGYLTFAEGLVSSLFDANEIPALLKTLSSILSKYLNAYEKACLYTLDNIQSHSHTFPLVLLFKHSCFDQSTQFDLHEKCGSIRSQLDSVYKLLSKLDSAIDRRGPGIIPPVFGECMLHGIPSHHQVSSGLLVSFILTIRRTVRVLEGLLKIKDAKRKFSLETEVSCQILDLVMAIKSDRIFGELHQSCEDIYHCLTTNLGGSDYRSLYPLKQMEKFLREINTSDVGDSIIHECILTKAIDCLNTLRNDPLMDAVFKFYICAEDMSEEVKRIYASQRGDLMVFIDSLDNCLSESVNVKVLNIFSDLISGELCPGLKQQVQTKYLNMDLPCLSKWMEKRMLGCTFEKAAGVTGAKGSSVALRESTVTFVTCLIFPLSELHSRQLHDHVHEAMLLLLDSAFMLYDIQTAKSYFHFVVQLSSGEMSMKLLLKRTIMLMEKLASDESHLQGLQFLFCFLRTILTDSRSHNYNNNSNSEKSSGKSLSSGCLGLGYTTKPVGSRKVSESLVISASEGVPMSIECDATSVDDDEDDGTSDGEVASLDKDEDEDASSDKALASKVCTFTSSGSNFMEQHWYFCYTCDLTVSKGCCSVCAKVCHRGHRVVYSRSSRFFCDCGAGGVRGSSCQCLKPRKFTGRGDAPIDGPATIEPFLPFTKDGDQLQDSDSEVDDNVCTDLDDSLKYSISKDLQDGLATLLDELEVERRVLELCSSLLPPILSRRDANLSKDKTITLGDIKVLTYGVDVLQLKKAYKSGSLDLKIKGEYANTKEIKSLLSSGSLVKSLLSVSIRGRLAVGEGDKVAIFDVGQLIGQATIAPVTADKANVKPLSKNIVRFEIVHLIFNPMVENYLAVAGYEDCQVLTLSPRGEVADRLAIELALQGSYIRRVDWVPGSQVQLMVITNRFVKIYDLSQDNISPVHYYTLPDDMIVDATLCMASKGRFFLVVLSESGVLFKFDLCMEGEVGARQLKEMIQIHDRDLNAKGSSLFFSLTYKLLFLSYQDGTTLMGQLNSDATSLTELSAIYEDEHDGKLRPAGLHHWKELRPAGLHHWKELHVGSGLFVCFSSVKSNCALSVSLGTHELLAQSMQHSVGSASPTVGITAYKPVSKDKIHCLVLHDDGSLQIYSHVPIGADSSLGVTSDRVKRMSSGILKDKAYAGVNPEFPLDFFENTVCITADVKLGGDAIRNGDSEGAKQSLASEDGFIESPSPAGFKVYVSNSNPDVVMVGFRVHVGNVSANHIPSEITIFERVIKLDDGMRCWYDIPFAIAESLLADEEFTISVGPTFNGSTLSRIDSLEIYGRAKEEFGWKEKMDALLGMEARALGSNSWTAGYGKKFQPIQSAPIQEQVMADGMKVLSAFYPVFRSQLCLRSEEVKEELRKLKCKQLLETIFESDREPLLQAAASHVLQNVFPRKELYHQVKDTMRLFGVLKSTSIISSRLGVGGTTGMWVIEEFMAQIHAVSKIALHRRANLATFLEMNGSEVVDELMQVLWGILDIEQPDTQTMNNVVVASVELIYSYAECLALHGKDTRESSVAPAAAILKRLLFSTNEAVQRSSSLAISSRLLHVPFPKQTILASDDAVENTASAPVRGVTSGGNTQVMIEEDSITSSVQYSCDGCSTVPILRRRWHCTICPDFDLCEACYEVLDTDRLPPPHSRDHPMSALPIELESFGGEGNEIHFSTDEISNSTLLRILEDSSLQSSAPSIHVLEPNESGDFSASVTDPVSISASKRAVNSLLLSELLNQIQGWMETTSGVRAIPIMQLFYRLSSAVGGPFINGSKPEGLDLEKLINCFLEEINLKKPFLSRTRSSFREAAIIVFMFFTLMLRNWHHPGTDGSASKSGATEIHDKNVTMPSLTHAVSSSLNDQEKNEFASQLVRACSSLRQQSFVDFMMDILQQLVHVFKSPPGNFDAANGLNSGSGCGALLTVRRELPTGNFSPFFSDSYVKAHRTDIFIDYHRLLLENAFRLVYSLVRPEKQDKTAEKEKAYKIVSGKDLKLDGYQDVLCYYINNPHTTFVRRYARRLFLHLCGSKTQYYSVRDSWQFTSEVKKLNKHVSKSGGFQNPSSYERSVKIVKCLSTMAEVAASRPRNWQRYCLRHGDILPFLLNGIFYFGEESAIQTLKLLNLAFYTGKDMSHLVQKAESGDGVTSLNKTGTQAHGLELKKKKRGEDGTDVSSDKTYLDMESVTDIFSDKGGDILRQFIDSFLLEWNSSSVRIEAKGVLFGLWNHGKKSFKETMLMSLLQKVNFLPMYGQNIIEYTELLTLLLGKILENGTKSHETELVDRCLTPDVINCVYETLHSQNELLANHPNSRIYNTLIGLVEFDGYYLESEPCVTCSSPEVPYSRMKLESLKSETKFTDNRIIVKCTGSYTIQTVIMNVHDAGKSKSVKVLNLYYNNRPVADLSELKNNWSLWKRAKSCHLAFNQTELKVDFPIPITACNFMIELDSFYENLQALSLEPLQCPRCSRPVTDKHGICSNCHENAYQCRQCRNINYENLDSFLCNECGYSKYGRFEFNFMAKPSFTFDTMENEEDMKKGLTAIESESENAHRRYQQLLGFKKPLLKIVSSIGENEMDSQQKDSVQQMMVSLPGPSCKINRKIALLGVLYGEKCKAAFDSVSKSVQTLQGLRRVLMSYLHQKKSESVTGSTRFVVSRTPNSCYGCATVFVTQCLEILQVLSKHPSSKKQLVTAGILSELFENNIHQGPKTARVQARAVLCAFSEGDMNAVAKLNSLIQKKVMYCLEHHRSMDISLATHEELLLLSEVCSLIDDFWEARLRVVFQLLFSSIKLGARHPAISENVILPCLRITSQACTPPKPEATDKEHGSGKTAAVLQHKDDINLKSSESSKRLVGGPVPEALEKTWDASHTTQDMQLLNYSEWEKGASYLDFVRRQYRVSQAVLGVGQKSRSQRCEYLSLKYALRWKHRACKTIKADISFELGSWVTELVLSLCSQSIRSEMCMLINLLCAQSASRRFRLLNLLMTLLPATLLAGENAAEYFELLFKMVDSEDARLFLTVRDGLSTICKLITQEVSNIESLERSLYIDISQGFTLHKIIELLGKFLEVPNIRSRFMRDNLLSEVLEALIVIRGLVVQKTKLICDCNQLLKDILDSLLLESGDNKRAFIRACIGGLQIHGEEKKGRSSLFILEQLCNLICPSKLESVYLLVLNKAHTQEEFIRGSMTKNPYSSAEIGPLMRDVKNKICHQLDMVGLVEDDYGMELLVAGNIISLDLSIAQVYEQVWKKSNIQSSSSTFLSSNAVTSSRDCLPMTVTYRLQGLDGEATEPMIKELEEDREESQDPEVEFAIAGAVREYGGLEIIMGTIKHLRDDLKSNQEQLIVVLNLLGHCCKIRENRRALLRLGALGLLLETARRAFSIDAMEPAEGILLIVESLTLEANEIDGIKITQGGLTTTSEEAGAGEQAKKIVLMFLERLSHPSGLKKSNKQQRNTEMVTRILPYLTYGEPSAMEALIQHFHPYLQDWREFDRLQKQHEDNPKDENIAQQVSKQRFALENFVRVSESLKTSSCGERLKDIILENGITGIAVGHLRESFSVPGQAMSKSTVEWASGLKLPSVPLILSMLKGLSMGHLATQVCIDEGGILPLLHALEGVSGENEIGARAENLLDTLSNKEGKGDGFLEEKVRTLRHATRDEMRRRALRKREELLQGLGMRQELASDGGERIVVARPLLEGFEDMEEEEDGLACMVCREGYSLRPNDLLGVYTFSKRVNLGGVGSSGSGRGECVYTTVSHFNIIHFQCHQEAKRADASLKNPKKEWEGATLRNSETLSNALFPIRGPSVPLTQYVRYIDQYWDNLNALGRADGSRLRLLTYDIVLMLARFATGASFSTDSKGGGKESNSRFLPFMIQMARHLLDQGGSPLQRQTMAKAVVAYLNSSSSTPTQTPTTGTEETVQFMMVNSLLSESYESWLQHRRAFLQRGIYHAYVQHKQTRSTPSITLSSLETDDLFPVIQPMLVYTGLIEQLQRFFKVKNVGSVQSSDGTGFENWEVAIKDKLLNVKEMVGFSKELLPWLEDITSANTFLEAFDVIGVLPDVLSQSVLRCEDFVVAAINNAGNN